MAAPISWNEYDSQKPRFNQRNFPQMTQNQGQNMQRFDPRIPPPRIHQGFTRQFNPAYNINSTVPPPTQRFSRVPGISNNPAGNFVPGGNQDIAHFQTPSGSWEGSASHMQNSPSSFPPPAQGSLHGWNERDKTIRNSAENSHHSFHQPVIEKQIEIQNDDEVWVKTWCEQRAKQLELVTRKQNKSLKVF